METQKQIGILVDDLFFASRIISAAEASGRLVRKVALDALGEESQKLALVVVDLNLHGDPIGVIKALRSDGALGETTVVGFFSHVDVELKRRAEDAGFDQILPRSQFFSRLNSILTDYGKG